MKLNLEIDCTPAEARAFFGLPDVKPVQDAVMQKIEKQLLDAVAAMSPDAMMKAWLSMAVAMPEHFQSALSRFYAATAGARDVG